MTYSLKERDFAAFCQVPSTVHGPGYHGVELMRGDLRRMVDGSLNPSLDGPDRITFFTVSRAGVPVGRVTAQIHDKSNRTHGVEHGYFGFFDCEDQPEAAALLLDASARWLRDRGCGEMIGNVNVTTAHQMGVLCDGFKHTPYIEQAYNAPHIPVLLETAGFERFFPMSTFEIDLRAITPETLDRLSGAATEAGTHLQCVPLRRKGLDTTLETCRELINKSFATNPFFVPFSSQEFHALVGKLSWIMDERLSSTWMRDNVTVAVVICIPDLNPFLRATGSRLKPSTLLHYLRHRSSRGRALFLVMGVLPAEQGRGVAGLMVRRMLEALISSGYQTMGTTWVWDGNTGSLRQFEKMGARRLHRLHLFRKAL